MSPNFSSVLNFGGPGLVLVRGLQAQKLTNILADLFTPPLRYSGNVQAQPIYSAGGGKNLDPTAHIHPFLALISAPDRSHGVIPTPMGARRHGCYVWSRRGPLTALTTCPLIAPNIPCYIPAAPAGAPPFPAKRCRLFSSKRWVTTLVILTRLDGRS